ncbi:MAG: autotransporter outer membrane beta-barrel domain-containing protein [Pseudomonadota bacterium]
MADTGTDSQPSPRRRPRAPGWSTLLTTLILLLPVAQTGRADLEDGVIGTPQKRQELSALVSILRQLQTEGELRGDLSTVSDQLNRSDDPQRIRDGLRALLPPLARLSGVRDRFTGRTPTPDAQRRNPSAQTVPPARQTTSLGNLLWLNSTDPFTPSTQLWLEAYSDRSENRTDDVFERFEADNRGFSLGADFGLRPGLTLGLSVGSGRGELDSGRLGQDDLILEEYGVSLSFDRGDHAFFANLAVSNTAIDRVRVMLIETETARRVFSLGSEFDTRQTAYGVGYSYFWDYSPASALVPFATVNRIFSETDDYIERGEGTLSLEVASEDLSQTMGSIGVAWSGSWSAGSNWLFAPNASLSFEHDFQAERSATSYRFINIPRAPRLRIDGLESDADRWRFDIGLGLIHSSNFSIGINYQAHRKEDYRYDAAIMNIQLPL